jgi:hypothetical protein
MKTENPSNLFNTFTTNEIPGENFLVACLQKQVKFSINNKIIKQGRLLLFRKTHYYIHISITNVKNEKENFEIPFPFNVESHEKEGLLYFDYRLCSTGVLSVPPVVKKISSSYFDKILEMQVM